MPGCGCALLCILMFFLRTTKTRSIAIANVAFCCTPNLLGSFQLGSAFSFFFAASSSHLPNQIGVSWWPMAAWPPVHLHLRRSAGQFAFSHHLCLHLLLLCQPLHLQKVSTTAADVFELNRALKTPLRKIEGGARGERSKRTPRTKMQQLHAQLMQCLNLITLHCIIEHQFTAFLL